MEGLVVKTVLVAGSSGLVGSQVVFELLNRKDVQVIALLRSPNRQFPDRVRQVIIDYARGADGIKLALGSERIDAVVCAIGSTMRAAGSKKAFREIEYDIPITLLAYGCSDALKPKFIFVSSVGADRPLGFYLKTKHDVEDQIFRSKLPYVIVRPSLLLGDRSETRLGELAAQKTMPILFKCLSFTPIRNLSWVNKYRPVDAKSVARLIVREVMSDQSKSSMVLEGADFFVE